MQMKKTENIRSYYRRKSKNKATCRVEVHPGIAAIYADCEFKSDGGPIPYSCVITYAPLVETFFGMLYKKIL
jgi:hypothetical protein